MSDTITLTKDDTPGLAGLPEGVSTHRSSWVWSACQISFGWAACRRCTRSNTSRYRLSPSNANVAIAGSMPRTMSYTTSYDGTVQPCSTATARTRRWTLATLGAGRRNASPSTSSRSSSGTFRTPRSERGDRARPVSPSAR